MNVKNVYDINFAIITEDDLKKKLSYVRSEDITDELMTSALVCATIRVDALSAGQVLTNLDKMSDEAQQKVKLACCFLAQYYLSGGYTWLRGSTSVSAGQINISQSLPDEPDYIIEWVYQLLQITNENLFKPTVSFKREFGTETYDNTWIDTDDFNAMSWEQALRMFLKAWNFISSDKSVSFKVLFNNDKEPVVDLMVNVPLVNKYTGDNATIVIDEHNEISAKAIKDDTNSFTPTDINNALIQKADLNDLNLKADQNFQNCDLKNLIAPRVDNKIVIDTDTKKLLVLGGGSSSNYQPDGNTIKLNDDGLTISAIGLKTTTGDIITADYLKWIKNNFVNKNALNVVVSSDAGNVLKVSDKDKKLYVAKGQGTQYFADEKTVHLDTSNNQFSATGVLSGHTDIPVITGDNLYKLRTEVEDNVKTIEEVEKELKTNETKIANNTRWTSKNTNLIATNKENIEINRQSIRITQDFINNKVVKKDALNEIVVSKRDKPDNILQALNGNQLYVPKPSDTTLQWKQFAANNEYAREIEEGNHYRCKYNGSKQFENGVFYEVYFWFTNLAHSQHFQFLYMTRENFSSFCIYGWNNVTDKKITLLAWFDGQDILYEKFEGNLFLNVDIYELKTTYLKPLPILTKRNIYKANKTIWKMEDFDD